MRKILLSATVFTLMCATAFAQSTEKGPFKLNILPKEIFDLKSKEWKPFPNKDSFNFTHANEFYSVIGKRSDGTLMVLVRQPSTEHPGKTVYTGSYLKCGVLADVPFFSQDAKGLEKELAEPSADASELRMVFDKTSGSYDIYSLVCP